MLFSTAPLSAAVRHDNFKGSRALLAVRQEITFLPHFNRAFCAHAFLDNIRVDLLAHVFWSNNHARPESQAKAKKRDQTEKAKTY